MTVSLFNSDTHTLLWRQYVGARGGSATDVGFPNAYGEGIDYSTSAAGNAFLMIGWEPVGMKRT